MRPLLSRVLSAALVLLLSAPLATSSIARTGGIPERGFAACSQFFAKGVAPAGGAQQLAMAPRPLCYDAFAVLHSGRSKTPVYVAQRLSRQSLADAKGIERVDRFFADARLPSRERAELSDYKRSGYSRGHMAPAADMPSVEAKAQSFSLANMIPQAPRNNQKPWASIENATRKYVERARGNVYVITGPVYGERPQTIGANNVWVPGAMFKLVYDESTGRAWANWLENNDDARVSKPITYDELVRRTGTEFLPGVRVQD